MQMVPSGYAVNFKDALPGEVSITPYGNATGRIARGVRATGTRAPAGIKGAKTPPGTDTAARNAE